MKCNLCGKDFKNLGGLNSHLIHCERTIVLKNKVVDMYRMKYSIRDISKDLCISKSKVSEYIGEEIRNLSESNVVAHERFPEKFKHSEKTKEILRKNRIEFMKNHPEKTAWRLANLSYPEKLFLEEIEKLGWDKKYLIIREKSFFPYFIDFAFENEKVAVEIDGSQHLEKYRKQRDEEKDKLLIDNGWTILRFFDKEIKTNISNCFYILEKYLNEKFTPSLKRIGIVTEIKKYIKKERKVNGLTIEQIISCKKQRKVERPNHDLLIKEINEIGKEGVGRKYGVSGNSVKKWIKYYEKYEQI